MRRRPPLLAVMLLLAPCVAPCVRRAPAPRTAAVDAHTTNVAVTEHAAPARDASVDVARDAVAEVPSSLDGVIDAVRRDAFDEAARAAERLPSAAQDSREGRYLRARIALELGHPAEAVPLLHGLDARLPALRGDIVRLEASALLRAQRYPEARAAYEALAAHGGGDRDRAQAAIAAWQAGDRESAASVMRAWPDAAPPGVDRGRAWRLAAQCLEATGDPARAAVAWRRLAVDEPDDHAAAEALAALTRLRAPLTYEQTLSRAAELITRARYTESLAALDALRPARGRDEARRLHLLGRANYGARDRYLDAHRYLTAASRLTDNEDRAEDAFLAARALARADRDDDAVVVFDQVARSFPGRWGDEAAFRAAWLQGHHARVEAAVARFTAFLRDHGDAAVRLRIDANWHLGWTLFQAGRYADAIAPLERSGSLATHHMERGRGRYWSALARARSGDEPGAVTAWQELIALRPLTWYALLAESRLREREVAVPPLTPPPPARPTLVVELPPRVQWLHALGFDHDAGAAMAADESRLRATLPGPRADEALAAVYLTLGEARRAFTLSSRHADDLDALPDATTRWVWDAGFPRPHPSAVEAAEDTGGMPRHYLYAIMRQESGYNSRDVSSARAIGLLQMIPPTTRRAAAELGIPFAEEMLYEPAYNIRVGGYYIGRLFRQYHGLLPRTIGSFNAGPGAMSRWIREFGELPLDEFVERIPFDETRTYVRRVIQNLARYRYLYGPYDAQWPMQVSLSGDTAVDPIVDY